MADDRVFNFNGPTVFNDIHDNKDCTIIVPSPTDNTKKAAGEMKRKPRPTVSVPTMQEEYITFRSRGTTTVLLQFLRIKMIEGNWLSSNTDEKDFIDFFSGKRNTSIIYWASDNLKGNKSKYGKGTLVFLFQELERIGIIAKVTPYTIPNILMHHVADFNGVLLTGLDKGDPVHPHAVDEIKEFVKLLKFDPTKAARDDDYYEAENDGPDEYDDSYDSYDHQDLQYHNKRGF